MHPYFTFVIVWLTIQYWRLTIYLDQFVVVRKIKHIFAEVKPWLRFVPSIRPTNIVIAICGKKGSGKDTSAKIIQNYMWTTHAQWYRTRAFAKPLKDVVQILTQCSDDKLHTHEGKESVFPNTFSPEHETYRDILKSVGKATRRFLANWMHQTWRRETAQMNYYRLPNLWIVTDLRLDDELKWLRTEVANSARVFVVRVDAVAPSKDSDITEVSVDAFPNQEIDFTIYNHTWDDHQNRLQKDCERMCEEIMYQVK